MAGDWIKMNKSLPRDPRIFRIASALKADRLKTVGGVLSVFCLFDEQTETGKLDAYTPEILDEMIPFEGLTHAMESVGWMIVGDGFLEMPRFDEHNGTSAKRRAQDRDRKKSVRKADKHPAAKRTKRGLEIEIENREESLSPLPLSGGIESEREGDLELIKKIRSIHPLWDGTPDLSRKEREAFTDARNQLDGFCEDDWDAQRAFLHARLEEGDAAQQVKVLQVYLENPNRTLGAAKHWRSKQPKKRPVSRPQTVTSSEEVPSPEETAEMFKVFKPGGVGFEKQPKETPVPVNPSEMSRYGGRQPESTTHIPYSAEP